MKHYSGLHYILLLIVALLVAEAIAIGHAIEHSIEDKDEICFLCDKADSFQYSLLDSFLPSFERTPNHNKSRHCCYPPYKRSLTDNYPRGPPLSRHF